MGLDACDEGLLCPNRQWARYQEPLGWLKTFLPLMATPAQLIWFSHTLSRSMVGLAGTPDRNNV